MRGGAQQDGAAGFAGLEVRGAAHNVQSPKSDAVGRQHRRIQSSLKASRRGFRVFLRCGRQQHRKRPPVQRSGGIFKAQYASQGRRNPARGGRRIDVARNAALQTQNRRGEGTPARLRDNDVPVQTLR